MTEHGSHSPVAPPPRSWKEAADEIRAEARIRGDLDERTVQALAARLDRLNQPFMRTHAEVERVRAAYQAVIDGPEADTEDMGG